MTTRAAPGPVDAADEELALLGEVLGPTTDSAEVGRRLTEAYSAQIPDYNHLGSSVLQADVAQHATTLSAYFLAFLADGMAMTYDSLARLRQSAIRRYHQGISMESLLHSYRLWGRIVLAQVAEHQRASGRVGGALALRVADDVMAFVDFSSVVVADAFRSESLGASRDRGRTVPTHLLEPILAGYQPSPARDEGFARLARELVPVNSVLVARCLRPPQMAAVPPDAVMQTIRKHLDHGAKLFIGQRGYDVVTIRPEEKRPESRSAAAQCDRLAAALPDWAIGVGRAHPGLEGIRSSHDEASQAVDLAVRLHIRRRAVHFKEVMLHGLVGEGPFATQVTVEVLDALAAYDARSGTELTETLRAYHESRYNLTATGDRLRVHPNTVAYRLGRVRDVTGLDPDNPNDLLLLTVALVGQR